jgi:hypothetical protein
MPRPEHTCAGMHHSSCEACYEALCEREAMREEYPTQSRYAGWEEPDERDVAGGL